MAKYFRDISADPIGFVKRRFDRYGDMYYAPVRGTGLYVTRNPEHLDEILRTKARSFVKTTGGFAAERLRRLLGDGLVNIDGELWRRHRRMINPALSRQKIEGYAPAIVELTERELDGWQPGQTVDIARQLMAVTLRIVTKVLFDHDAGPYVDRVHEAMEAFRASAGLGVILPDWVPYPPNRRWQRAIDDLDRIIFDMIAERRATGPTGDDLLSNLVAATDDEGDGTRLTATELRDELLTLFFAGHETTSNALAWTLYLLSQNPDAEAWVREELDEVGDRPLTAQDASRLPRTLAAIEESMRIFPPVTVISRTASEDVEIGGFDVTAGSEMLLWFYWTHHDSRWFPEPESYQPQRFIDEPTWPRAAYMPFGGGQRICIGKHFALMEATLILATILRRRRLAYEKASLPVPGLAITLAPKGGLEMRVS